MMPDGEYEKLKANLNNHQTACDICHSLELPPNRENIRRILCILGQKPTPPDAPCSECGGRGWTYLPYVDDPVPCVCKNAPPDKQKPRVTREWVYETIDDIQDESFDRDHAHVSFKAAIKVLTKRLTEAGVEVE